MFTTPQYLAGVSGRGRKQRLYYVRGETKEVKKFKKGKSEVMEGLVVKLGEWGLLSVYSVQCCCLQVVFLKKCLQGWPVGSGG